MRNNTSGFTLIELVVVIIILGILAVTAAPKFINLNDDADIAVAEGMASALSTGVRLARAQHLIEGEQGEITLDDGSEISFMRLFRVTAFPQASSPIECQELWNNLTQGERASLGIDPRNTDKLVADYASLECRYTINERAFSYSTIDGTVQNS
ncbi:prepilin-type N-terminal cleavage/methylation domain-containing protein [Shewanella sp. KX20019]|uniref:type II secretion system protein n=1 Tax=Shewanella sp. KX20019 TaxID=2803864 RepID=UPI00192756D3|nr:prepilin-type N-terminal cleavage/methylation domain-containing protein [Shewanella sp. KX20019]QQX78661.1 prepilin-type N-terminal cleavage/methylation domain-containing protein [Shewanella sp. KX20019]